MGFFSDVFDAFCGVEKRSPIEERMIERRLAGDIDSHAPDFWGIRPQRPDSVAFNRRKMMPRFGKLTRSATE
jgi:hypothetical protein